MPPRSAGTWRGVLAGLATLAASLPLTARAEAPASLAGDPDSIWTIQVENDVISTTLGGSDSYYSNGLRLGWTSGQDKVPDFVAGMAHFMWGDGSVRVSVDVNQQIYTPFNTALVIPDPHDRPVAGYLAATFGLQEDHAQSRSVLALTLGVIGPSAQGQQIQNGFHKIISDKLNNGWGYQLPDEAAVEVLGRRVWRVPLLTVGPLETDILPALTAGVGTVRDYVQAGVVLRFGMGLQSDYGASRIRPGINGGDAFTVTSGVPWYIFVGADGQAVAHDAFLDGGSFRTTASVPRNWLVGEMEAGVAVIVFGTRISYTQTWQTASFKGQRSGLFNFGSLSASVKF